MPKLPGKAIIFLLLGFTLELFLLSKDSLGALGLNVFIAVADVAALLGTVLFALSFMLAARTYLVEEAFGGLDRAYRVHHKAGVWSFSLLVVHLAAVLIGYRQLGVPLAESLIGNPVFVTGELGIILMAAIILTIIFAKIKYQRFVLIQKFFVIPYAFGFYHLAIVPSDVSRYMPLRYWVIGIVALGLAAWLYREFLYRYFSSHAAYAVKTVETLPADIVQITLAPKGAPLRMQAGQFAYFSFRTGAVPSEPHPFSLASAPGSDELVFAAKASGDYTALLKNARPGDEVVVYGPYGKFFSGMKPGADNIFIAGGIGITPFLSALRGSKECGGTTIFYTTRSEADSPFDRELHDLSCKPDMFHYHFHGSDQRGFLTADIIEKRAGGLAGKTIYLCGPAPMMKSLTAGFLAKGVPRSKIVFEAFSY